MSDAELSFLKRSLAKNAMAQDDGDGLKALAKAVHRKFPKDRVRPGILVSWLGDVWYVSVQRFKWREGQSLPSRKIVAAGKGWPLGDVVAKLMEGFE